MTWGLCWGKCLELKKDANVTWRPEPLFKQLFKLLQGAAESVTEQQAPLCLYLSTCGTQAEICPEKKSFVYNGPMFTDTALP